MTATLGKIAADFSTTLNLKTAIGATSATLDSATDDDGVALPTGTYFLTLDRKSANKEYIKCTLTSTALTDIYHVSRQGALTSGTTKTHRKGATVEITDFAIIKKMLDLLDGTTDLNASVPLKYDGTATISNSNHLATKAYVDGVAIAGGADASTTVKGLTKLSTAPASATDPIAVGDNDNRVSPVSLASVTADRVAAMEGTGTPNGTTGKFVTNDDTATAATANKVARRLAGGNITVVTETTGNNTTNAASTAFVQQEIATLPSVNFTVNTNNDLSTYYTWGIPIQNTADGASTLLGFTSSGKNDLSSTANPSAGGVAEIGPNTGAGYQSTLLPGTGSTTEYTMSLNKILRIKFRLRLGATGNTQGWGFHASGSPTNIYVTWDTTTNGNARFVLSGSTLYAETSNATDAESTDITSGITVTDMNLYEIVINGTTSILYYINGVLKATHTTRIPTGALSLGFGASTAHQIYISSPTISLQL